MILRSVFRQLRCISSTYSLSFVEGLALSWPASATQLLLRDNSPIAITRGAVTWLGIIQSCGRLLCMFTFGYLLESISKPKLLLISALVQVAGWLFTITANSLIVILASQLVLGAGMVLFEATAYNYVAEVSSPRHRAISAATLTFVNALGYELTCVIALLQSYWLLCLAPFCFSVVAVCALYFALESPYHLILVGREEEALKNLSTLNPDLTAAQTIIRFQELQKYTEEVKADTGSLWQLLKSPVNLKICLFLFFVNAAAYINGSVVFTAYGPIIVEPYRHELNTHVVMNLQGSLMLVGATLSPVVMDAFGRRSLMLFAFGTFTVLQLGESVLFFVETASEDRLPILPTVIVGLNLAISVTFQCTLIAVVRLLDAEMFPYSLKVRASCFVTICRTGMSTIILALFFTISSVLSTGFNFLIYAITAFVTTLVCHRYYRETKDLTLMEIRTRYAT